MQNDSDIEDFQEQIAAFEDDGASESPFLSNVPLASTGISPAQQQLNEEIEQEEIERREEYVREYRQAIPSAAAQKAKEVYNIAAGVTANRNIQAAKATLKNHSKDVEKTRKQIEENLEEKNDPEHASNVRIMNEYREIYKTRITYNFKKRYTFSMNREDVAQWRREVETMISVCNLPQMMKDMLVATAPMITVMASYAGIDCLHTFPRDLAVNTQQGMFDEEIQQLSVTWGDFFSMSAEKRLLGKYAMVLTKSADNGLRQNAVKKPDAYTEKTSDL